ncbi:hypothetical protein COY60_03835 [Candidatus Gracilibacteria bacterium CG_4_10_14_0_8_um_filter_38_28]|nr:MAG: hypothetical protein COY60_03835 [Candidatus Gracilibacteria bacterium CG_4_10_14_0_8_um_filter_38_28]
MRMLLDFKIRNFLSIKDEVFISFEANKRIASLNENKIIKKLKNEENLWILKSLVFYGGNASGKTNIIKGLLALKELSLNSFSYKIGGNTGIKTFLLDSDSKSKNTYFEINFLIKNIKYNYSIELNEKQIINEILSYYPQKEKLNIFTRQGSKEMEIEEKYIGINDVDLLGSMFPRENQSLLSILFDRISAKSILIKDISDFFLSINFCLNSIDLTGITLSKIKEEKYKKIILDFLQSADINIKDIVQEQKKLSKEEMEQIPPNLFINGIKPVSITEVKTYFSHPVYRNGELDGEEKFDFINQESEGTKRLFSLIGPIIDTIEKNGILFIDEIDTHLHFLLLENLIKFIHKANISKGAQFLFNTHNIDLLDLELFRKDQIWFTEKDKFGATSTYALDEFKDIQIRNNSDIKKAYKLGIFGGIPTLSDFYI